MNLLPTYKEMVSAAIITAGIRFVVGPAQSAITPFTGFLPTGFPTELLVTYGVVLAGQKVGNMI